MKKKSKYKGVFIVGKKFRASICSVPETWKLASNRKKIDLGTFNTEEDAAIAYNNAAKWIHGKGAKLNEL